MIWVTDASGALIYLSPEWETLTGQSVQEAIGLGWLAKAHADDRAILLESFVDALLIRKPFVSEFRVSGVNGQFLQVLSSGAPTLLPDDGTFIGYFGALTVTDDDRLASSVRRSDRECQIKDGLDKSPKATMESLADQLLLAHEMAVEAGEFVLVSIVNIALLEVGRRLVKASSKE